MANIILDSPENVFSALSNGKKLAIFAVDDHENPIFRVSGIFSQKSQEAQKNFTSEDITFHAVKYIKENYNKSIKLDYLAGICDVSKSYLCRLFKDKYGKGVTEYLIDYRIERAKKMLSGSNSSVVIIALEVGYADCGYFNRLFKKRTGVTPLEYRKNPSVVDIDLNA